MRAHKCDETCVCPVDGRPLYFHARSGEHACANPDCVNAHGMVSDPVVDDPDQQAEEIAKAIEKHYGSTYRNEAVDIEDYQRRLATEMEHLREKGVLQYMTLAYPRPNPPEGGSS